MRYRPQVLAGMAAILSATSASARTTPVAGAARIAERMEVVGADGARVDKVDEVENGTIVLTRSDRDAGGRHHAVPIAWIGTVDGTAPPTKPAADVKAQRDQAGAPKDDPKRRRCYSATASVTWTRPASSMIAAAAALASIA